MVAMTYNGKARTVRRGPRVYNLTRGTFDANVADVAALVECGARVKADGGASAGSTESEEG